jgi:hypothetical protein
MYAVNLEQLPVINLGRTFPSLETFSLKLIGFATLLLCVSVTLDNR